MSTRIGMFAVPAVLAAAAWAACPLPAQANGFEDYTNVSWHRGFYISGFVGSAFGGNVSFEDNTEIKLDAGFLGGGTLGYDHLFAGPIGDFRFEAEASYRQQDFDDGAVGEVGVTALMGNLWYDFALHRTLVPYAGIGLGAAFLNEDDNQPGFAFQVGGGLAYHPSYRTVVGLNYRYLITNFDADGIAEGPEVDYRGHQFSISVGYKF